MTNGRRFRLRNTNSDLGFDLTTGEIRVGNPQDKWEDLHTLPNTAQTRPISSSYRALRGVRDDITSTIVDGVADPTGMDTTAWADHENKFRFVGCTPTELTSTPFCVNNAPFQGSDQTGWNS